MLLRSAARPLVRAAARAAAATSTRSAATSTTSAATSSTTKKAPSASASSTTIVDCPRVMVDFGYREVQTFISHPGVMFVSKLIDMPHIARPKARLTESTVHAIGDFDSDLGRKAKIALDHDLAISFFDLDEIEEVGALDQLLAEKAQTAAAADAAMKLGPGNYSLPASLKLDACFPSGGGVQAVTGGT